MRFTSIKLTELSASRYGETFFLREAVETTFANCVFLDGTIDKYRGRWRLLARRCLSKNAKISATTPVREGVCIPTNNHR